MAEGTALLCQRMEVLKQMMATTVNRLTLMESMVARDLMQQQMEVMKQTLEVFFHGNAASLHDVELDEDDERMIARWRSEWTKI